MVIIMTIGIDIDGVLTDLEHYIATSGKKYTEENHLGFDDTMGVNSIYGFLCKEDSNRFWDQYWEVYARTVKVRDQASIVIQKLRDDGNKIIIITARTYDSQIVKDGISRQKSMEKLIVKWLNQNHIVYDKIVFSNLNKLRDCLDHQIDVMIEDSVSNMESLKNDMRILCFDAKYNRYYMDNQVQRVYSWKEIYDIIHNI